MKTPWGLSQHKYSITEGVFEVDTAGHGGILVHVSVAKDLLSPEALALGWQWGEWYAYEEDCDWAIFAYEQPALYATARNQQGCTPRTPEETKQNAREIILILYPDYLSQKEQKQENAERTMKLCTLQLKHVHCCACGCILLDGTSYRLDPCILCHDCTEEVEGILREGPAVVQTFSCQQKEEEN